MVDGHRRSYDTLQPTALHDVGVTLEASIGIKNGQFNGTNCVRENESNRVIRRLYSIVRYMNNIFY